MEFAPEGPMAIPMWVNGHAFLTVSQDFFDVTNPVTGEAIRRVPLCGASEAAEAVAAARGAQPRWADMGMPARRVCLTALADALDRYTGHFAKLLTQECGFDDATATAEVAAAVAALQGAGVGATGVFGLVLDASRPLVAAAEHLSPALLAGATVVVKPSPRAPSAVFALCELTSRCEWPAGVVNLLQGDTAAIGGLCAAGVDRLVYAGNAPLGVQIGAIADAAGIAFEMKSN
ncbi:aldehyde dehydrogenase family protein [Dechloromonas sp.]|uniref:aldehyde dehydrogenase family protein n=1 Tax=Dechloromonas sp. TaxID=1917218 RepID=UPI002171F140|nr:aldehyde dehydrogenase family protein [Dechloromonas sp.]MBU3696733.1 aldehyde dehydrogenase family protein [Dechloromonas sp.]